MRKQQLVRDAIWDAAIQLFADKGFDETTVDDIAEAAGTSRRSFFRYFDSKSDLMAHAIVSYGTSLTDAIRSCPPAYSLSEVFRHTVLQAARHSAAQPRTRQIMQIAAKYPAAREAQISRVAEVQDQVAEAFAERCRTSRKGDLTAHVLAGLTLSLLSVTFRFWFQNGQKDIAATVDQVFATVVDLALENRAR
jgi:AcrR family transcriptional regulator